MSSTGSSETGRENPCNKGTYGRTTGLTAQNECTQCSATFACDVRGLDNPVTKCNPGYYCKLGAPSPSPLQSSGGICFLFGVKTDVG